MYHHLPSVHSYPLFSNGEPGLSITRTQYRLSQTQTNKKHITLMLGLYTVVQYKKHIDKVLYTRQDRHHTYVTRQLAPESRRWKTRVKVIKCMAIHTWMPYTCNRPMIIHSRFILLTSKPSSPPPPLSIATHCHGTNSMLHRRIRLVKPLEKDITLTHDQCNIRLEKGGRGQCLCGSSTGLRGGIPWSNPKGF